ncbi:nucleotide exchange factor GrpE [Entomomonas moraniae]|uniref:Protein GrpE n=1 Tax=Entomomonas moraniae TaxID=2213226 RepID=A0A3Q9JKD3_9GAMM|nr:nucleotide exchange factor GrpE [Entomomonas moraniae]AZS51648.1 nucleotide exchange factor GrpE [Entomomonas moraniae]
MSEEQKQAAESNDIENTEEQKLTNEQCGESARVAELESELEEAKNQVLRAAAEVQNMRRRVEQDIEKAHKFALEKFASDLLPVLDSLERGIEVSVGDHDSVAAIREGMELTLKVFKDTLKRFNIEEVNPEGEPFNPDTQQAMAMEPSENVEPNTVLKVFQKGYLINGRLLRPAMVVVSKAP